MADGQLHEFRAAAGQCHPAQIGHEGHDLQRLVARHGGSCSLHKANRPHTTVKMRRETGRRETGCLAARSL